MTWQRFCDVAASLATLSPRLFLSLLPASPPPASGPASSRRPSLRLYTRAVAELATPALAPVAIGGRGGASGGVGGAARRPSPASPLPANAPPLLPSAHVRRRSSGARAGETAAARAVGVGTISRTRTPNPNYPNPIPNYLNPNYPINISGRNLRNPNLIRVIRVLTPGIRNTRTPLKPNRLWPNPLT